MDYEITDITLSKLLTADPWVLSSVSVLTYTGTHGIAITPLLFACTVTSTMGRHDLRTDQYPCGYIISCASSHQGLFPFIPFLWLPPCLSHAFCPQLSGIGPQTHHCQWVNVLPYPSSCLTHQVLWETPLILLLHLWSTTSWKPITGSLLTLWVSVSYWAFLSITFFVLK